MAPPHLVFILVAPALTPGVSPRWIASVFVKKSPLEMEKAPGWQDTTAPLNNAGGHHCAASSVAGAAVSSHHTTATSATAAAAKTPATGPPVAVFVAETVAGGACTGFGLVRRWHTHVRQRGRDLNPIARAG